MCNVRMVLTDGDSHSVDSSEMAFATCTSMATKQGLQNVNLEEKLARHIWNLNYFIFTWNNFQQQSSPVILEPIMKVEVSAPVEFQGSIIGNLTRRRGLIVGSETVDDYVNITCEVGLSSMFGYSTDLRSSTQGKGEFSMEYCKHAPIPREDQVKMISDYAKEQEGVVDKRA